MGPNTQIHTFTIGRNKNHPDIVFARKVSALFGTLHTEFIPTAKHIRMAEIELFKKWPEEERRPGNIAVFLMYKLIASLGFECVIAHDGIDELLGGYWEHRSGHDQVAAFEKNWNSLAEKHLILLERKAKSFYVEVVLPYLQKEVVDYITRIPVNQRTSFEISKAPLREIAKKYLPDEIIKRKKVGFCDALKED